jgi:hypothetical protein
MIRTTPKPLYRLRIPLVQPDRLRAVRKPISCKPERTLDRSRMTLAIGMGCPTGLVFAADTRLAFEDGSVSDMCKMTTFDAGYGQFTIVQSSYDANAGNSLLHEVAAKIKAVYAKDAQNAFDLEGAIKEAMQHWYLPVHENRPLIQLLVGAHFPSGRHMYLCEPPHTVSPMSDSYMAIGGGRVVTDPIYTHWLAKWHPRLPHACLCRAAYLMHKAKQLLPAHVGGHTDAVFISAFSDFPYFIKRRSMAEAEAIAADLDHYLAGIACCAMSANSKDKASYFAEQSMEGFARFEFECDFPPNDTIGSDFDVHASSE